MKFGADIDIPLTMSCDPFNFSTSTINKSFFFPILCFMTKYLKNFMIHQPELYFVISANHVSMLTC